MTDHEAALEARESMLRYLSTYPDAEDTVEGIAGSWLPKDTSVRIAQQALVDLLKKGLLTRKKRKDGATVYSAKRMR
jgi:hypothetical protein